MTNNAGNSKGFSNIYDRQNYERARELICTAVQIKKTTINWTALSQPQRSYFLRGILILSISRLHPVQYAVAQYRYFKEWRKDPQWSFSCCIALLLSISDLQGDISDLVETDAVKSQQPTVDVEMSTILTAVEESKATDILEQGDRRDREEYESKKCSNNKCHQGTQTEITTLLGPDG